ncbi:cAMP response element binding (CREB) protein [Botryosphaeria dothidea]|uniref:cAMP response element binding (CREB) protein n=1 Tax=Botryosphaeria dothidea TaxID=55169 RepID=A0A8H4N7H1_9PEZI|nr:cAMP response element binding (CREB) protein [Botryosphaeria dothidea]
MTTITESVFAFDPPRNSSADTVDLGDSEALSSSFSSFFDDAFMGKLVSARSGNPGGDFPFGVRSQIPSDPGDPGASLETGNKTASTHGMLSESSEGDACDHDAMDAEVSTRDDETDRTTAPPQAASPGGSERTSSERSKKSSSSRRGRPKIVMDAERARRKREQTMEKNRIAASKCREKKKNWMAKMDDRHRDLSTRNEFLKAEIHSLRSAILGLKELVFQHMECGYAPITEYVKAEAKAIRSGGHSQNCTWIAMGRPLPQHHIHTEEWAL